MGQLRDWWPSKDSLLKRSPALPVNVTCASPPLQLLEAAAILNEDKDPSSAHSIQSHAFASSPATQACLRTPIKLINSQDHKQELLRNLLNLTPADHSHAQAFPPTFPTEDDSSLNLKVTGSFAHLIQQVHSSGSPSSSQPDNMPLSLFGKGSPSPTTYASSMYHPSDESLKLEKIGVGAGAFEMQQGQAMPAVEKTHNHSPAMKEAESKKGQISHGSLHKASMEKSCSSHSMEKHTEKTYTLHNVEEHPINKGSLSRREIHIYSERQRRKGMTHLYTTLLSLLPEAKLKTDRCKVLTDAIEYIQMLREQMEVLGSQKAELITSMAEHEGDHDNAGYASSADGEAANSSSITGISDETKEEILSSADVAVRFCGQEAFITLNSCKSKGVWSKILQILHEQELEIFNVTLSSGNEMDHHCIHARVPKASNIRAQQVEKLLQDLIVNHSVAY